MFSADFVDANAQPGIFFDKRAGGSCVIEMNVGKKQRGDVGNCQSARREIFFENRKARGRAAINECEFAIAFEKVEADGFRAVEKVQVNNGSAGREGSAGRRIFRSWRHLVCGRHASACGWPIQMRMRMALQTRN